MTRARDARCLSARDDTAAPSLIATRVARLPGRRARDVNPTSQAESVVRLARLMRRCLTTVAFTAGACVMLASQPVRAEDASLVEGRIPSHLSLAGALAIFRAHGFDLLLAEAAEDSAHGDLERAQAFPNPVVSGAGGHTFTYDPGRCESAGCSATQVSASVSDQGLLFDLMVGKRRLAIDVARAALDAAHLSRADAERTLAALLKQQYVQTVSARATVQLARDLAANAARTSELVGKRRHAGEVSEADAARAETSKLEAEQAVDVAEQTLAVAYAQLAFLLGVRGVAPPFEVDERLPPVAGAGAAARAGDVETLVDLARRQRPDLAAADAEVRSTEAALTLARRQRLPDVSLVASYQQEGHGQEAIQPPTFGLGLSLPLPVLYRNAGEITKAETALRAQRLLRDKLEAQVVADVRAASAAFTSARTRVARMEDRLLERAGKARDLVAYQYEKGAVSLLERLDSERTFAAVNAEYLQALDDFWSARYQLEQAIGGDLPA